MEILNTNDQRVEPTEGVRLKAGQSGHFEGGQLDSLLALDGVVEADSSEADEYRKAHPEANTSDSSASLVLQDALNQASRAAAVIAQAPQQRVIGDDEAPHGPPTGVVTTRQLIQEEEGDAHFGTNEAAPSEAPDERIVPVGSETEFDAAKREGSTAPQRQVQAQASADTHEVVEEVVAAMHPQEGASKSKRGRARAAKSKDDTPGKGEAGKSDNES